MSFSIHHLLGNIFENKLQLTHHGEWSFNQMSRDESAAEIKVALTEDNLIFFKFLASVEFDFLNEMVVFQHSENQDIIFYINKFEKLTENGNTVFTFFGNSPIDFLANRICSPQNKLVQFNSDGQYLVSGHLPTALSNILVDGTSDFRPSTGKYEPGEEANRSLDWLNKSINVSEAGDLNNEGFNLQAEPFRLGTVTEIIYSVLNIFSSETHNLYFTLLPRLNKITRQIELHLIREVDWSSKFALSASGGVASILMMNDYKDLANANMNCGELEGAERFFQYYNSNTTNGNFGVRETLLESSITREESQTDDSYNQMLLDEIKTVQGEIKKTETFEFQLSATSIVFKYGVKVGDRLDVRDETLLKSKFTGEDIFNYSKTYTMNVVGINHTQNEDSEKVTELILNQPTSKGLSKLSKRKIKNLDRRR